MSLDPLWDFFTSSWVGDIIGLIGEVIRVIPYTLLFLLAFLIMQGLMATHAAVDMGAGPAARALVHGAFLDRTSLSWSLGVPIALVLWKWLESKVQARRQRRR